MKRIFTRLFALLVMAMVLGGALLLPAETSADMEGGYGVSISGGPCAVDSVTLYGETIYAEYRGDAGPYNDDDYYVCKALVRRFYKQIFGLDIWFTVSGPKADSGTFRLTNDPKVGDIILTADHTHVALVKERWGNEVTILQQNSWWRDYYTAWVGATASIYDKDLLYYTWDPGETLPAGSKIPTFDFYFNDPSFGENTCILSASIDNNRRTEVLGVGCRVYDSYGTLLKEVTRNMSCYDGMLYESFNLYRDMGLNINATETYAYEFVVYFYGFASTSPRQYFCASGGAAFSMPVGAASFSSTDNSLQMLCGVNDITRSNATLYYSALGEGNYHFEKVQLFLGTEPDCRGWNLTSTVDGGVKDRVMLLNLQGDAGITLNPGTTYYFFVVGRVNGARYVSGVYTFTTEK